MPKHLPKKYSNWWVLLLEGLIQLVLGLLLLFSTDVTIFVLIQLLGLYWLIRGIIMIILVFVGKEAHKGWMFCGGILGFIAGLLVLRYPVFSGFIILDLLIIFIALVGIIQGTVSLVKGISDESVGEVLLGIVLWVICLLILFNPISSILALPLAIGILWVLNGILLTVMSLSVRK